MKIYQVNTDGGARGNPGPAAIGVYVAGPNNEIHTVSTFIGTATNNVAEYSAVIAAFELLLTLPHDSQTQIKMHLDSQLVARQLKGLYRVKDKDLQTLFERVKFLERSLHCSVQYTEVPRLSNKHADFLVNKALDFYFNHR